jgi:pimeloyl-ACP methyl ester carboxylesterase
VGHSLGGGIALLTYFDSKVSNSGIDVKGLVLIDSAGYSQNVPFFVSTVRNPLTRFVSHLLRPYDRVRFVLESIIKVKEQVTPERIYRYAYFLDMPGSRYALLQTAKQIRPHNASELAAQFSTLTAPTLIVWGSDDPVILVENAYRFNSDIPGSRLVVFPDTGHIPHEERARQTFTILDEFLRSV